MAQWLEHWSCTGQPRVDSQPEHRNIFSYALHLLRLSCRKTIMGHNSVTDLQKKTANNPNLDLVNINSHTKFGKILSMSSQNIEQKRKPDINQSVTNLRKMTGYDSKLDLVNINAHTKLGQIPSTSSQDIERKLKSERNSDIHVYIKFVKFYQFFLKI